MEVSIYRQIWNSLTEERFRHDVCPCRSLAMNWVPRNREEMKGHNIFSSYIIGLELEDKSNSRKCFEYLMFSAMDFGRSLKGIEEASQYYFHKRLTELTEDEILKLHIMTKALTRYNPISNPENLERALKHLKSGS